VQEEAFANLGLMPVEQIWSKRSFGQKADLNKKPAKSLT
jgi:hypothetical protein